MSEFKLWYAYYDSFFLNANPKLSQRFYDEYSWSHLGIYSRRQHGQFRHARILPKLSNFYKHSLKNQVIGQILNANYNN